MNGTSGVGRLRELRPLESEDGAAPPASPPALTHADLDPYYRTLGTAPGRSAASTVVQTRIERTRERFSGPYRVEGQAVTARPMFRVNGGMNESAMQAHAHALDDIAQRARASGNPARGGYGSPENLVRVTQALIDAGKLPPRPGALSDRIRAMQWEWGIGVDCAAYTRFAFEAAMGRSGQTFGLNPAGMENFTGLARNTHFSRTAVAGVRPGDIMTLTNPTDYGHNVIVYDHRVVDESIKPALIAQLPSGARVFFASPGPHHAIEVDSSWSAGASGESYGGYRRDVWLYDESSKAWGYVNRHTVPISFETSALGPAGDHFSGAFRARGA